MSEHEKKLKHGGRNNPKYIKLAFDEYGFERVCNRCSSIENICVHHIDNNFLNNSKNNMEILCSSCHMSHHHKGKKLTKEHIINIKKNNANKGKYGIKNHTSKQINQLDNEGNIIETYGSIMEAQRKTGINNSNIVRSARVGIKAGGYRWEYFLNN